MENNPTVLIPAGIGDAYWVMVKMEAFCRSRGITGSPQVIILNHGTTWEAAKLRSIPFLKRVPFITVAGWVDLDTFYLETYERMRVEHYTTVMPNFMGYDYFISYNGLLNTGHWLEEDSLDCNWHFALSPSKEEARFMKDSIRRYRNYAVFYFSSFTKRVINSFSVGQIIESITHFCNWSGLIPIFVGADWDLTWEPLQRLIVSVPKSVNLVGRTTLNEVFGLLKGAKFVSGYHSGLTNMAIVFGKKTILLWDGESFPSGITQWAISPPGTRYRTYIPLNIQGLTIERYLETMVAVYNNDGSLL